MKSTKLDYQLVNHLYGIKPLIALAMTLNEVIVYTTPNCPKCNLLKRWLKENSIPYKEKNLAEPDVMAELIMRDIFALSAPVLRVSDKFYLTHEIFDAESLKTSLLIQILGVRNEKHGQ